MNQMHNPGFKITFSWIRLASIFLLMLTVVSCEENVPEAEVPSFERGTVTDNEGNVYITIKIGNQWWMAENLRATRYNNGDLILQISDSSSWNDSNAGAYCEYENGSGASDPAGFLYNHFAVVDTRGIAPTGWRVPSDDDWRVLERALGMSETQTQSLAWRGTDQGDQLKSSNADKWVSSNNSFPTNKSGFDALAGSCRLFNGLWGVPGIKYTGFWWSSTGYQTDQAWYRYLDYNNPAVFRSHVDRRYGMSIRCVKQ